MKLIMRSGFLKCWMSFVTSKLYGVDATIIIFVFVLYCIVLFLGVWYYWRGCYDMCVVVMVVCGSFGCVCVVCVAVNGSCGFE